MKTFAKLQLREALAWKKDAPETGKTFFYKPYISDHQIFMMLDLLDMLDRQKGGKLRCFEYGAGWSTVFFPRFFKDCEWISIEHLLMFIDLIKDEVPGNVTLHQYAIFGDYPGSIHNYGKDFDFVFVDGERREDCIFEAHRAMRKGGVIVKHDAGTKNVPLLRKFDNFDVRTLFEENGVMGSLWWGRK